MGRKGRQPVRASRESRSAVAFRSGSAESATVDGSGQPAQRWSTSSVDGVRCVLPTYITNTYPHTPHSRVVSVRFVATFEVYKCPKNFVFLFTKEENLSVSVLE